MLNSSFGALQARSTVALGLSLIALSAGLTGCIGAADPGEDVASAQQADEDENGLTMNGLAMNGLAMNGLAMNGLTTNGLTLNGLSLTSVIPTTLGTDPLAQMFMSYVVSCALPSGQNVVFPSLAGQTNYTFAGGLGLAPQWGVEGGLCDQTCQQWISACAISRVNALGQHVPLSERGNNPGLALAVGETTTYPNREATYFGNVFMPTQIRYACRTAGDDQTLIGRPCGNGADVSQCAINVLGDCNTVCSTHNADGSYANCTTPAGTFSQAVTVYRM